MEVLEIILGVVMLLLSIVIIGVVLLQQGHRSGINGAISGGADTFLSKNNAKTADALLGRITKYLAGAFFVIAIATTVIATLKK